MASTKTSAMGVVVTPAYDDVIMIVQAATNYQCEVDNLVKSAGGVEFTGGAVVLALAIASTWYDLTGWTTVKTRGSASGVIGPPPGAVCGKAGAYLVHYAFSGIHATGAGQFVDFRILDDTGAQILRVKKVTGAGGLVTVGGVCWLDATTLANPIRLQAAQIGGTGNLTQYDGRLYAQVL